MKLCRIRFFYADTSPPELTPEQQLGDYLQYINTPTAATENCLSTIVQMRRFDKPRGLFSRLLCTPATSAPVERVFSQSGLLLRPHRARMSNTARNFGVTEVQQCCIETSVTLELTDSS